MDNFMKGDGQPNGKILYGCVGAESEDFPGTYRFCSTDGLNISKANLLSPDADINGGGTTIKPIAGSLAVAVMTHDGCECFIIGFHRPPQFDEESDDPPQVGNAKDNQSSGDKVFETVGKAKLILKRGGMAKVQAGEGVEILMNPLNNRMTIRAANMGVVTDGYMSFRGRLDPGEAKPPTVHREEFLHQVGSTYDRFKVQHGSLPGDARRQLSLEAVTVVASKKTATILTRETYGNDGSWLGEGKEYYWGTKTKDEPAVLGTQLVESLTKLIDLLLKAKVNTAWGPSTPIIPPESLDLLALKNELTGKILSNFLFLSKEAPDL